MDPFYYHYMRKRIHGSSCYILMSSNVENFEYFVYWWSEVIIFKVRNLVRSSCVLWIAGLLVFHERCVQMVDVLHLIKVHFWSHFSKPPGPVGQWAQSQEPSNFPKAWLFCENGLIAASRNSYSYSNQMLKFHHSKKSLVSVRCVHSPHVRFLSYSLRRFSR